MSVNLHSIRPQSAWIALLVLAIVSLFTLGGCPGGQDGRDNDPVDRQTGNAGQDPPDGGTTDPDNGGSDPGDGGTDPGDGGTDPGAADSPLKGTWTGNIPYQVSTTISMFGSQPFHTTDVSQSTTMTFDAAGRPDRVTIILSEAPLAVVDLPLADLDASGDKLTVPVPDTADETVTATVETLSTTDTAYSLRLALVHSIPRQQAEFTGPYELKTELGEGAALTWQSTVTLTMAKNGLAVTNAASGSGELVRQ